MPPSEKSRDGSPRIPHTTRDEGGAAQASLRGWQVSVTIALTSLGSPMLTTPYNSAAVSPLVFLVVSLFCALLSTECGRLVAALCAATEHDQTTRDSSEKPAKEEDDSSGPPALHRSLTTYTDFILAVFETYPILRRVGVFAVLFSYFLFLVSGSILEGEAIGILLDGRLPFLETTSPKNVRLVYGLALLVPLNLFLTLFSRIEMVSWLSKLSPVLGIAAFLVCVGGLVTQKTALQNDFALLEEHHHAVGGGATMAVVPLPPPASSGSGRATSSTTVAASPTAATMTGAVTQPTFGPLLPSTGAPSDHDETAPTTNGSPPLQPGAPPQQQPLLRFESPPAKDHVVDLSGFEDNLFSWATFAMGSKFLDRLVIVARTLSAAYYPFATANLIPSVRAQAASATRKNMATVYLSANVGVWLWLACLAVAAML